MQIPNKTVVAVLSGVISSVSWSGLHATKYKILKIQHNFRIQAFLLSDVT